MSEEFERQVRQFMRQHVNVGAISTGSVFVTKPVTSIYDMKTVEGDMAATVPDRHDPGPNFPAQTPDGNKPRCPTHKVRMTYDPSEDRMLCTEAGCTMQAKKSYNFQDSVGAPSGERPAVYKGAMRLVFSKEGEPFLYLVDVNAMVSIAPVVSQEDAADPKALSRVVNPVWIQESKRREDVRQAERALRMREKRLQATAERVNTDSEEIVNRRRRYKTTYEQSLVAPVRSRYSMFGVNLPIHCGQEEREDLLEEMEKFGGGAGLSRGMLVRIVYDRVFPTLMVSGMGVMQAVYKGYDVHGSRVAGCFAPSKQSGVDFCATIAELFRDNDVVAYVMAYGMEIQRGDFNRLQERLCLVSDMSQINTLGFDVLARLKP